LPWIIGSAAPIPALWKSKKELRGIFAAASEHKIALWLMFLAFLYAANRSIGLLELTTRVFMASQQSNGSSAIL
jgi:hypothetical protein